MLNSNFVIDSETRINKLVIRDVGPWNRFKTVTNDIENVVLFLIEKKVFNPEKQSLYYYDSHNELTQVIVKNGKFFAFAPV